MSLPPANHDPQIDQIRQITSKIYSLIYDSFGILAKIVSSLSDSAKPLQDITLKNDIGWAKESLTNDTEKLIKLKDHIKFINAQETHTTKNELLKIFDEFTEFSIKILLDDFITTLKGIISTSGVGDLEAIKINNHNLDEVVDKLIRFQISLKITAFPLKSIKKNSRQVDEIELDEKTLDTTTEITNQRISQLASSLEALNNIITNRQ